MRITLVIISLFMLACQTQAPESLFTKLPSQATGIFFNNVNMEDEKYNVMLYEYFYNGGGVAVGDINNDGLADLYFTANQKANRLYLNKGNLQFEDITETSGTTALHGWKTGTSMVDVNGDGLLDIYVCRSAANDPSQRENSLYINQGDLTFKDEAITYGLNDNSYSTHASFLDYDRDGDLDMFLLNHSVSRIVRNYDIRTENKKERVPFVGNKLFKNTNGRFNDVSQEHGIYGPAHNYGLGICYSDVNNDGWLDLYASNDYTGSDNFLINDYGRFFHNAADSLLTHMSRFSMGTDIADVNNDGMTDILTLDMLPDNNKRQKELFWPEQYDVYTEMVRNGLHHQYMRNMLHLNNGNGSFSEIGQIAGISNTDWSWSALFADYDNDGLQDLFVSNGYKRDFTNNDFLKYRADQMMAEQYGRKQDSYVKMIEKIPATKISNYIFKNVNGHLFSDKTIDWGMVDKMLSHGAAYADLDNDGDLDLVANNMDEPAAVYRNNSETFTKNSFLKISLKGNSGNTFGLGAKVTVYDSGSLMLREQCPYRGFQSSVDQILNFGLGDRKVVDSLVIVWPTGEQQKLVNVAANQTLTLYQKDGSAVKHVSQLMERTMFHEVINSLPFEHHENDFIDFKVQPLLYRMYSTEGPALASGDVNNDNLTDFYIGGAKGQEAALILGRSDGQFTQKSIRDFTTDAVSEDVDAVFFDMDGDHDDDLYVVTGGYEFKENDPLLQDKLYQNDGVGNFKKMQLPSFNSSGSCARPCDIDGDGDLDLFVGGRIIPGRYPEVPESNILINNGSGHFTLATDDMAPHLKKIGMVTDAVWIDVNDDRQTDLIVAGEWMGVHVFENSNGKLSDKTNQYIKTKTEGFWNTMLAYDFDNDGDQDVIIGNYGLNNQIKASGDSPATLYYSDFDENGSVDPIMCHFIKDKSYPFPTRDELTEQLPHLRKRFSSYSKYANTTIDSILTETQLNKAAKLNAYLFETTYFQNDRGSFTLKPLPLQIQFSPVFALAVMDVNNDGDADLLSGGNLSQTRARTGRLSGNSGFIFTGDGNGSFEFIPAAQTGINVPEDVRHIIVDKNRVFFATNNSKLRIFSAGNDIDKNFAGRIVTTETLK